MIEEQVNPEPKFTNLPPWRQTNANLPPPPREFQHIPPPFEHPLFKMASLQNRPEIPMTRTELESVLREFLDAMKCENDGLRKEVKHLHQGMNRLCQEMRSTFLAQRPVELPLPSSGLTTSNSSNKAANQAPNSETRAKQITLPSRPPTVSEKAPVIQTTPRHSATATSQTPQQAPQPASYSKIATANPEKPWTTVKPSKSKSQKTYGTTSLPAPLKTARPERERRIIFRRRAHASPLSRHVAVEMLYRLNKVLQSKSLPTHMRFIKLGYNSSGNLTGLVSENATANMLLPTYGDLLLKTILGLDQDVKEVVEDLEWIALKIHSVEIERYHHDLANGLEQVRRELLAGPSELDLPFTPRWISSQVRFEHLVNSEGKKHSSKKIVVRTREEANRLLAKGVWFGGVCHKVELYRQIGPDSMCPTCCHWGHTTYNCPNSEIQRCELCSGPHLTQNHQCTINGCNKGRGKQCIHITIKCANCGVKHTASSHSCKHYREAAAIAKGSREEWKAREKLRETALQAEENESGETDEDLEEQGQKEDSVESETSHEEIQDDREVDSMNTDMGENMEGVQDESSNVTRADSEQLL